MRLEKERNRQSRTVRRATKIKRLNFTIDDSAKIVIVNNTSSRFVLKHEIFSASRIVLDTRGAETELSWVELKMFKGAYPQFFELLRLLIDDVSGYKMVQTINDDGDSVEERKPLKLDDVIAALGLEGQYTEYRKSIPAELGDNPDVVDIEDFILDSEIDNFKKIMKESHHSIKAQIADVAGVLFMAKQFGDIYKQDIIEEYIGEGFFEDMSILVAYKKERGLD